MRLGVYMLAAATAVSLPGIVANQMGWRIGDLSMFEQEEDADAPDGPAPQLVTYDTGDDESSSDEMPVDESMLPQKVHLPGSFVALPDDTMLAMRDRILAARGDAPKSEKPSSGGH